MKSINFLLKLDLILLLSGCNLFASDLPKSFTDLCNDSRVNSLQVPPNSPKLQYWHNADITRMEKNRETNPEKFEEDVKQFVAGIQAEELVVQKAWIYCMTQAYKITETHRRILDLLGVRPVNPPFSGTENSSRIRQREEE
jgi:hypothetical protein